MDATTTADGPRPIESPAGAVAALTHHLTALGGEDIPADQAVGRVLAKSPVTDRPSPAADVSALDGYAVCVHDAGAGVLPVVGESRAGSRPDAFQGGTAMKISTGAIVPHGADAIVRREDCEHRDGRIYFTQAVHSGAGVRRQGENAAAGAPLGRAGDLVTPALAGACAMFGARRVAVHRRVRIAILVTGDEVIDAAESLAPWQLRDSNGPALRAMLGSSPWVEVTSHERTGDDSDATRSSLRKGIERADLLLVTGGVSVGEHDVVPAALSELGARTVFHRLKQRPGRPALGAVLPGGKAVLALPGNPVSVLVTARRMARPVAAHMAGIREGERTHVVRIRGHDRPLDLWWHRLARLVAPGVAEVCDGKGSGDLIAAAASNGFVEIPPGETSDGPWPFYPWAW